ncbi:MAG TPA: endonuclease, partial [Oceanipulchritudo sp.]|nr:endonuclease [Oceanipulchritudo sp.]
MEQFGEISVAGFDKLIKRLHLHRRSSGSSMFIPNRLALSYYRVWLVGILSSTGLFAQDYTPPAGYYAGAEDLLGESLRTALHAVIDGQNSLNYFNDLPILWTVTEAVPGQPGLIQLIYSGKAVSSNSSQGGWNREHTWPQSYGAGTGSAFSDAHHIFPADSDVNKKRNNYIYDYAVVGVAVPEAPDCLVDEG